MGFETVRVVNASAMLFTVEYNRAKAVVNVSGVCLFKEVNSPYFSSCAQSLYRVRRLLKYLYSILV